MAAIIHAARRGNRAMDAIDERELQRWVGCSETRRDVFWPDPGGRAGRHAGPPAARHRTRTPLPPLWHWLYFLPLHRASELGPDGHVKLGGFCCRCRAAAHGAGSRSEFPGELRVGDAAERVSTIESVAAKQGRSGPLVFVTVRHEVFTNGAATPALREVARHRLPRRQQPGDVGAAAAARAGRRRVGAEWQPDDVLLFRYSALTFNGHRIHYDRRYVTEVEGYLGLIVHGPLIATLLLDLLGREWPAARLASFAFKALRPTFDGRAARQRQARRRCDPALGAGPRGMADHGRAGHAARRLISRPDLRRRRWRRY